ncbi:MAG: LolA family protein [Sciscionella sp.]
MRSKKVTLGAATAGAVAGVVGLVLLSAPAGAGQAPSLPRTTPETLVSSVLDAKPAAFAGTVEVDNELGLPALPNLPQLGDGKSDFRVWSDGAGRSRVALPSQDAERTLVDDGRTLWAWNSADRTVTKIDAGAREHQQGKRDEALTDPGSMAKQLVTAVRRSSDVGVDGTASVAGRDAYQLVLTPKPTERTLLRQVRVAVDDKLRMPLAVDVYTNGSAQPALHVGYSNLDVGAQQPSLFRFSPPAGTKVTEPRAEQRTSRVPDVRAVGSGWDTVLIGTLPEDMLTPGTAQPDAAEQGGTADPMALLKRFGQRVSGSWGEGWVISTKVGSALVTTDGKVAAGFVPKQVLTTTLGRIK